MKYPKLGIQREQSQMNPRIITFTIPGRPATKKTGQRIVWIKKRAKIMPSEAYEAYEEYCLIWLKRIKDRFTGKVKVSAVYTMPDRRSWPDLCGLLQATGDILERAGIIDNDRNIVSWDGSYIEDSTSKEKTGVKILIHEITPF